MAILVEQSGEQLELASAEAWSAASTLSGDEAKVLWLDGAALVLDATGLRASDLAGRLGLAHRVCDQAISGPLEAAARLAASVDIGPVSTFRVRARRSGTSPEGLDPKALEAEAGALIRERTGASVAMEGPEAEVRLLIAGRAFAGLLGGTVDRRAMEARAVRHRPFSRPVSIHPKYARAMVNLARVPPGGTIADPFCGTGGMLIEAGLMGYGSFGSDLDPRMVEGTRQNLGSMGLEAHLRSGDVGNLATIVKGTVDAVVTDPPYGRSTSTLGEDHGSVIERLFSASAQVLGPGGRLVVCLPSRELLPGEGSPWSLESAHPLGVHGSLTRQVCVLRR